MPAEGLDRGEEDVGVRVSLLAGVEAQAGVGADPAEGVAGLVEDLLAVGDEEDPPVLGAVGVEGAEPGLAEAGGEDDEAGGVALLSRLLEGSEGLLLDGVGGGDRAWALLDLGWVCGPRPFCLRGDACGRRRSIRRVSSRVAGWSKRRSKAVRISSKAAASAFATAR